MYYGRASFSADLVDLNLTLATEKVIFRTPKLAKLCENYPKTLLRLFFASEVI